MEKTNFYIGEYIKSIMSQNGITKAELARKLGVRPQSIDYLLSRKSVDTDTLYNLSLVLNHDFASLYSIKKDQTNSDNNILDKEQAKMKITIEVELSPQEISMLNLPSKIKNIIIDSSRK